MIFTIEGKIIPYVRMTRKGKFRDSRAQEYLANKKAIGWQIIEQTQQNDWSMLPAQTPLIVFVDFVKPDLHRGDLDNLAKAVIDAAQGIVFLNDCWIDRIMARRRKGEDHLTTFRVEIYDPIPDAHPIDAIIQKWKQGRLSDYDACRHIMLISQAA